VCVDEDERVRIGADGDERVQRGARLRAVPRAFENRDTRRDLNGVETIIATILRASSRNIKLTTEWRGKGG
jgi:hypothetical protein